MSRKGEKQEEKRGGKAQKEVKKREVKRRK